MNPIIKLLDDSLRRIIKSTLIFATYPYVFLLIIILNKNRIHELIYKSYFTRKNNNKNINKYLVENTFYFLPVFFQRKIINSSLGNDNESLSWAKYYRSIGFPNEDDKYNLSYKYLEDYINKNKTKKHIIHQVCASSAKEINYFSNFSEVINFEASDFTQPVVDYLQNSYPNLNCWLVDLTDKNHLKRVTKRSNLILAFGGLQYLLPRDLRIFFRMCNLNDCKIIIYESTHINLNPFTQTKSLSYAKLKWFHPYVKIAKEEGFTIEKLSTSFLGGSKEVQQINAHFGL